MVFGDPDHRNFNKYSNGRVSTFGDVVVGSRQDNVSLQFQYNISPDDVSTSNTNSGSVFQQNSMAQVSTGTDSSATAQLESHRGLRYLPGHEGYCYFTASFTTQDEKTGYPSSSQFVGAFNDNNGYFIGFQG
ncbi:hypothetical protein, partial [Methanohalobium sp.]|uniref:hypothetical protein n=1 Tax=Methanohalobium sp. TaxID=2837493 RepID=UPI0025D6FD3A